MPHPPCLRCHATNARFWRRGPEGSSTLCNYLRQKKKSLASSNDLDRPERKKKRKDASRDGGISDDFAPSPLKRTRSMSRALRDIFSPPTTDGEESPGLLEDDTSNLTSPTPSSKTILDEDTMAEESELEDSPQQSPVDDTARVDDDWTSALPEISLYVCGILHLTPITIITDITFECVL
ncbi:hypothetical protein PROFUN_04187 [Planoprotostelium fungivorum]|uniref:GATA-type domain-containing protein n=1 Tax=Planoprotostelium fungivorum TaxID=1890364 RepID=A0A2P6NVZ5_9EUKA|nr:hypothetical protein PROFUN_04187 [Planoprotostelium fungivorum]